MRRRMKPPRSAEIAVDALLRHETLDIVARRDTLGEDRAGRLGTVTVGEGGKIGLDRGTELSPVSRRTALPRLSRLEDHDAASGAGDAQRGMESGIARPDHDSIGARRHRRSLDLCRWRSVPPVWLARRLHCSAGPRQKARKARGADDDVHVGSSLTPDQDRASLAMQLVMGLREMILAGDTTAGMRLPASRRSSISHASHAPGHPWPS